MSFDGEDDELEIKVDDAGMLDRPFIATIRRLHDDENDQVRLRSPFLYL